MKGSNGEKELRSRIRKGAVRKEDVARRLAELAYGQCNDCVRLVLEEKPELETLDLSLLSEVRRSEKGTVEVRLIDRLRVLEQLERMTEGQQADMAAFLQAVQGGGEA